MFLCSKNILSNSKSYVNEYEFIETQIKKPQRVSKTKYLLFVA